MAKAISLHVGVNGLPGQLGMLQGCVKDAMSMGDLPELSAFRPDFLVDPDATLVAVTDKIKQAAADLDSDGMFVFTFSGHGSFIGDQDGDERDFADEGLVLNDCMLIDDVLGRELWPLFKPNTRILMIADSCYSGTVSALIAKRRLRRPNKPFSLSAQRSSPFLPDLDAPAKRVRTLSEASRLAHLEENRACYDGLNNLPQGTQISASVILLAACLDNETTPDGPEHGAFTQALLDVLHGSNPPQTYDDLIGKIQARLQLAGHNQTPVVIPAGQPNPTFRAQKPFTL